MAGVRAAFQQLRQEAQRFGWRALLVGSGLGVVAAVTAEQFVVDLAGALEARQPRPETSGARHWSGGVVSGIWTRLLRLVRGCEPAVRGWREGAMRIDAAWLARLGVAEH